MSKEKLNKWAELLLDTGKGNNLINFKDTKSSTAEIVAPDFVSIFSRAEHAAVFEVFDPKIEDEEDFEIFEEDEEGNLRKKPISKTEYIQAYASKLKKQQVLVYTSENKPIQAVKNIGKRANSAVEETGVNIAYLAFGFIHWTESAGDEKTMRAPILLVPVRIENESAVEPYYIKVTDDEIIVNPTFSFKLQSEYGIKLPAFDEDEGIVAYFEKIQALIAKLKWTITSECKLGIFSFLKINMYKDLKDNGDKIVGNGAVRALLGQAGAQPTQDTEGNVDLLDLHNVVDADSSQAEAVRLAKAGQSFVLQGPPGTGKSQTITNVIAECLLDGKKVLFVSEKLAALSVVYDKLKKVGLEEFCLELHSHKANKRQVIEELCHTLKLPKSGVSGKADKEQRAKKEAQAQLDEYVKELHAVRPVINKSLYQLYEETSACRIAPTIRYGINDLKNKGGTYLDEAQSALVKYVEYTPSIGYDYHDNVWYGYVNTDSSYQRVEALTGELNATLALCRDLQKTGALMKEHYDIAPTSLQRSRVYSRFFELVKASEFITPALFSSYTHATVMKKATEMQALAKAILEEKAWIDDKFDEEIYALDGAKLYKQFTRQFNGFFARLFSGEYRALAASVRLCKSDGKKLGYAALVEATKRLALYQGKMQTFTAAEKEIKPVLGEGYQGVNTDFAALVEQLAALGEIHKEKVAFGKLSSMQPSVYAAQKPVFAELSKNLETAFEKYDEGVKALETHFDASAYEIEKTGLSALEAKCEGCLDNLDKLDNWCEFIKLLDVLKALEVKAFIDFTITNNIPTFALVPAFKKNFCIQWIDAILHASPLLLSLARVPHDEAVKRFREKDELQFEINKAKIKAALSEKRPDTEMVAQGSSVAILLREGEKKRKQKGIRQLLSEIGELVQTLKPCFLMSPLSVSTFLGADMKFDVVVFDEASQIFPQDAIGAIYRGSQLIVVGDSKQMPPSNFFNATAESEADDESEDITDFESILDLCSTSFPQRRLKWHYRSRFEQLISFSNNHFYDNDLVTFPSSMTDKEGIGVDYVYVDGTFDRRTRTNRAEAERVVDMVFEHIEKYPDRSLGVVAFSISQQNLIDRLISRRRAKDRSKDEFFKSDREEPFFVKNLETVQGDERDTIIFSVAYAKDAQGKLLLNFGPVNRAGGERRLNVAITRAKCNVKLVSSMRYTDIDLTRTASVGAKLLRAYLNYAENGEKTLERAVAQGETNAFETPDFDFETEICEFLRSAGYTVDTRVGCSSFTIDLAVKRPDLDDYALAIEFDGDAYRSGKTARDRDRLRQYVLERMGWKYYRIWSTDWFRNKRVEKEKLLSVVKAAIENKKDKKDKKDGGKSESEQTISFAEERHEKPFAFPKYERVNESELSIRYRGDTMKVIRAMVQAESPLNEEWMLHRLAPMFGKEKITPTMRETYNKLMWNCGRYGIVRVNGYLYDEGKDVQMLRVPKDGDAPREVKYIAPRELALGLKELLKHNVTADKMSLFRLLAQQLGFSRVGDTILSSMESALWLIKDEIEINGETLSWKE